MGAGREFASAGGRRATGAGAPAGQGGRSGNAAARERAIAIDLAALAQAGDDRGDQQLFGIGMKMRIKPKAGGDDAGSDVRAVST